MFRLFYLGLFFYFLLFPFQFVWAQSLFIASGPHEFYLGERLELDLKLNDVTTIPKIEIDEIDNLQFSISDIARSFNHTTISNGKFVQSTGITIKLFITATAPGAYYVPGIFYYYNNQRKQSKGFTVKVLKAKQNTEMFTEVNIPKQKYYRGEKIKLNLRWYLKDQIKNFKLEFPLLDKKDLYYLNNVPFPKNSKKRNFKFGPLQNIPFRYFNDQKNGSLYTVYETNFFLFVERVGEWEAPIFSARGKFRDGYSSKTDFFGRRLPKYKNLFTKSKKKTLNIVKLPPEPNNFKDAVGTFKIKSKSNTNRVKVGEAINFSVLVTGDGNFYNFKNIISDDWKQNFEIYSREEKTKIKNNSAEFFYILRAIHTKINEIKPLEFGYFDPELEEYVTITTNSIPLKVEASDVFKKEDIVSFFKEKDPIEEEVVNVSFTPTFSKPKIYLPKEYMLFAGFVLPPAAFLILNFLLVFRKKLVLRQQKKLLTNNLVKINLTNFTEFISSWVTSFLIVQNIQKKNFSNFTQADIGKMTKEESDFILQLRDLHNKIIYGKQEISVALQNEIQKKMKQLNVKVL